MILPRTPQTHAAVADHYDELDGIYRSLWGEHVHHGLWRSGRETQAEAVTALSDLVGTQLGFAPGDSLVDIGCGYGATARRFAAAGAVVTGLTLSRDQIAHAPAAPRVTLLQRDWLANGLHSGAFEGAYAIESSEHMADKPAFFAQAARVLKPGGRLVVCAWLAGENPKPWHVRHLLQPICDEGQLPSMGSRSDYLDMAKSAGFDCTAYQDVSASVARTWTICLRRFGKAMLVDAAMRRHVLSARNRRFALSVPRLILAYRTGAMRYGVFTLSKAAP
ncbi:methyltransferase domain-containing protein [soil metagenome]